MKPLIRLMFFSAAIFVVAQLTACKNTWTFART